MNIVVLGGNCDFSNQLAKSLKDKAKNSLIYRVNLLSSLREMTSSTDSSSKELGNIGFYLGDVENLPASEYKKLCSDKAKKKALEISKVLRSDSEGDKISFFSISAKKAIQKTLVREIFSEANNLKNFFNNIVIYSGVVTKESLSVISDDSPVVFVNTNNESTWLPLLDPEDEIKKEIDKRFNKNGYTFFNTSSLSDLLKNKDFINLLPSAQVLLSLVESDESKPSGYSTEFTIEDMTDTVEELLMAA